MQLVPSSMGDKVKWEEWADRAQELSASWLQEAATSGLQVFGIARLCVSSSLFCRKHVLIKFP